MTSKVNEWIAELQSQGWQVEDTPVVVPRRLKSGQHRLESVAFARKNRQTIARRRRMVAVTALKYRARRKRK